MTRQIGDAPQSWTDLSLQYELEDAAERQAVAAASSERASYLRIQDRRDSMDRGRAKVNAGHKARAAARKAAA